MGMVVVMILLVIICFFCVLTIRNLYVSLSEVRKANRMKTAFLRNISNEIRTPLRLVSGLAELISKDDLYLSKNEKKTISDQLSFSANLIATLLDEVMVFSNAGNGHELEDESISPNQLCCRCIDSHVTNKSVAEGVKLVFKRELSDEFFIKSDRHVVELILNKLIMNACRFTKKGEIAVGCNCKDNQDKLTIYVQDTGEGIPENRKDCLFGWFENPGDMNDEAELDLSIAQKMAMKLGGIIRLDEHYTGGTRFLLILPVKNRLTD